MCIKRAVAVPDTSEIATSAAMTRVRVALRIRAEPGRGVEEQEVGCVIVAIPYKTRVGRRGESRNECGAVLSAR